MSATVVSIADRFTITRRTPVPAAQVDAAEVERRVRCYAIGIGCVESNVRAAVNHALTWHGTTELAIAAGKRWADKKRAQQPDDGPGGRAA